jgi:hypothetical protein
VPVDVQQGHVVTAGVEADGVRKLYGQLVAIENLTFSVESGEILGVLGPNGAGKTTAIRVLTTLFAPTRGTFAVAGVPHTLPVEIRRQIGVLPESAGYPEWQTGEEFIRYHARLYGHPRASTAAVADGCSDTANGARPRPGVPTATMGPFAGLFHLGPLTWRCPFAAPHRGICACSGNATPFFPGQTEQRERRDSNPRPPA